MKLFTNRQREKYENPKTCSVCKEKFEEKYIIKGKTYRKFNNHCHYTDECRGAAHSICNLKYSLPKETPIVFHNGCNYDYHFIRKS